MLRRIGSGMFAGMAAARPKGANMSTTRDETKTGRGRIRIQPGAKRVRAFLGGEVVADTARPMLVWEVPYYPTYYVPLTDVRAGLDADAGRVHSPSRGDGRTFTVRAGGQVAPGAALRYEDSPIEELRDLVRLDWHAMDAWSRRTRRASPTRATRTRASTSSRARGTSAWNSAAPRSPSRRVRVCSSKPVCPCATTSRRRTSGSIFLSRPTP
jgi:uncharacterized protein (DUF427 family)